MAAISKEAHARLLLSRCLRECSGLPSLVRLGRTRPCAAPAWKSLAPMATPSKPWFVIQHHDKMHFRRIPPTNKLLQVVDQCPECPPSKLDLFINAFSELSDPGVGIIPTSYKFVPCGIKSPLVLHNKSGTSQWWFSMQVVGANEPVKSLEVSTNGGASWQGTTRQPYNFFENPSGFKTEKVDVRVTSSMGSVVVVKGVSVQSNLQTPAGSNF